VRDEWQLFLSPLDGQHINGASLECRVSGHSSISVFGDDPMTRIEQLTALLLATLEALIAKE
jgi:hypothetical protein